MMIDKISGINPLNNVQSTKRPEKTESYSAGSDEITISDEAKRLSDARFLNDVAAETPDVRTELVEQIKQKIQDPNYLNEAVIASAADQFLSAYGL